MRHLSALWLVAALMGCRIEDHTPTGSRRDEDAVQALVARYARRLSERDWPDRKSTRLNSSHIQKSRMPSSA